MILFSLLINLHLPFVIYSLQYTMYVSSYGPILPEES